MKRKQTGKQRIDKSLEATRADMRRWFKTRAKRGTLSKVHDLTHVESVSAHAGVLAEELALRKGFSRESAKKTRVLAEAAGSTHDIHRRKWERKPHGVMGSRAIRTLRARYPNAFGEFTQKELEILADTTLVHETSFAKFNKAIGKFSPRKKIVARAVHIADKLFEASGYRVIDRRAFFVGKERLNNPKGLAKLKNVYGKNAPLYAVAMESCRRLRQVNVLTDYPKSIQPIAKQLHAVQEKWYFGLLKYLEINEGKLLQEMNKVDFPKLDEPKLMAEIKKANSDRKIKAISTDVMNSAAELVFHFNKAASPESALKNWKPKGKQAKEWLRGMKAARVGGQEYLQTLQRQIHRAVNK